jgi:hypothetical protein
MGWAAVPKIGESPAKSFGIRRSDASRTYSIAVMPYDSGRATTDAPVPFPRRRTDDMDGDDCCAPGLQLWLSVEPETLCLHGRRTSPTSHGSFFGWCDYFVECVRGWLGSNERLPLCTQSRQRSKMLDLRMLVSLTD